MRLGGVVMNVREMRAALEFWCRALPYEPRDGPPAPGARFVVLAPLDGEGLHLSLQLSDEPAPEQPSVHLDLYVDSEADQSREISRLESIGAQRTDWDAYPEDADFVVLEDPSGNRFCVVDMSA